MLAAVTKGIRFGQQVIKKRARLVDPHGQFLKTKVSSFFRYQQIRYFPHRDANFVRNARSTPLR